MSLKQIQFFAACFPNNATLGGFLSFLFFLETISVIVIGLSKYWCIFKPSFNPTKVVLYLSKTTDVAV